MSRFKTGNRIEDAIKHKNRHELEWALKYAQSRFETAAMKQHEKTWRSTIKRITDTLNALPSENT
jgi:hypothetical protein